MGSNLKGMTRAALALATATFLACSPNQEPVAKGPQPDLTVNPGLTVFFDSGETVHYTIVSIGADGKVSPLFEGKGRPGELKTTPINHPEGAEIRLRFLPAGMPQRGEAPSFFRAAEAKFAEIHKTSDAAEILYKSGTQSYSVTCDGRKAVAKLKQ